MDHLIDYNFSLSKGVKGKLEEISNELEKNILTSIDDDIELLTQAWDSESLNIYLSKYRNYGRNIVVIKSEIDSACEDIEKLSKRLYLAEQESEKIALERSSKGQ